MIRTHALVWALLVAAAVGVLFYTSHQTEELEAELDARNNAVIAEREAIRILRAEWAYLNEPGRLRELARRHTPLGPAMPVQIIAGPDEIPLILPGLGALPGLPLPQHKPLPGSGPGPMVSAAPEAAPTQTAEASAIVPPRAPVAATRPPASSQTSESSHAPLQALLANFRAQQSTAQAGAGQ